MEIILSNKVQSLTGSIGQGYGYSIRREIDGEGHTSFHSVRAPKNVPKDGHLKFIFACAVLARMGSHIADIRVDVIEMDLAIAEATDDEMRTPYGDCLRKLNAEEVLTLKEMLRL